jgi:hypothetical protein
MGDRAVMLMVVEVVVARAKGHVQHSMMLAGEQTMLRSFWCMVMLSS